MKRFECEVVELVFFGIFMGDVSMKIKVFLVAAMVFSSLNFILEAAQTSIAMSTDFTSHYDAGTHTLNLNKLGFTEDSLKSSVGDLICFINTNKVVTLLLEENNFASLSIELLKQIVCLLTSCATLTTVSLKNNFNPSSTLERGLSVSPAAMSEIASLVTQFQALFKESLTAASQTSTDYVTKSILLDNMPPLAIISEIPSKYAKLKTFLTHFGTGFATMAVTAVGWILTVYLKESACPANSSI